MTENKHIDLTLEELEQISNKDEELYIKSENTLLAYHKDFKDYENFCKNKNKDPFNLDYKFIKLYLTWLGTRNLKISTIKRRLSAISHMYAEKDLDFNRTHFLIKNEVNKLKRKLKETVDKTAALEIEDLDKILEIINEEISTNPKRLINYRDKAILSLLLYGGFRRSELSNLNKENVRKTSQGIEIQLEKSKADQTGINEPTMIYYYEKKEFLKICPARSYVDWLEISKIPSGRIFRHIDTSNTISHDKLSDKSISLIVKKWSKLAGLDWQRLSGHSGRAGFVTSFKKLGASHEEIKNITKHKSDNVLDGYDRAAKNSQNIVKKYLNR